MALLLSRCKQHVHIVHTHGLLVSERTDGWSVTLGRVLGGLRHHDCPSHVEVPGMAWVVECASLGVCIRVCVCVDEWMEIRVIGVDAVRGDSSEEIRGADPGLDLIESFLRSLSYREDTRRQTAEDETRLPLFKSALWYEDRFTFLRSSNAAGLQSLAGYRQTAPKNRVGERRRGDCMVEGGGVQPRGCGFRSQSPKDALMTRHPQNDPHITGRDNAKDNAQMQMVTSDTSIYITNVMNPNTRALDVKSRTSGYFFRGGWAVSMEISHRYKPRPL